MYYKLEGGGREGAEGTQGLSREQMERADKGFRAVLGKLRFGTEFIANNADEILAIAHTEYARALAKGAEIEDPIGWTIHCAWRRTQNLLTATNSRPPTVSSEKLAELVDEAQPTPEQIAEDTDRVAKVHRAIAGLSEDERALIYLVFFEETSTREAGRRLGWSPSKALRCERSALKHLKQSLGVTSTDELALPIGLAAWLALSADRGLHLPAGLDALLDRAAHAAGRAWARVQDLGRRLHLGGGGDAAGAIASSGGGRGLGACLAIAAACVAGAGAVGPSLGGVGLLGGHGSSEAPTGSQRSASGGRESDQTPSSPQPLSTSAAAGQSAQGTAGAERTQINAARPRSSAARRAAASKQVQGQTDAFARAASETSQPSPPPEATTAPASVPARSEAQVKEEFGAFR